MLSIRIERVKTCFHPKQRNLAARVRWEVCHPPFQVAPSLKFHNDEMRRAVLLFAHNEDEDYLMTFLAEYVRNEDNYRYLPCVYLRPAQQIEKPEDLRIDAPMASTQISEHEWKRSQTRRTQ